MATAIGTFTNSDDKITGKIQTLTLNAALTFLPNENQTNPDAQRTASSRRTRQKWAVLGRKPPKPAAKNTYPSGWMILPLPARSTLRCSNRRTAPIR